MADFSTLMLQSQTWHLTGEVFTNGVSNVVLPASTRPRALCLIVGAAPRAYINLLVSLAASGLDVSVMTNQVVSFTTPLFIAPGVSLTAVCEVLAPTVRTKLFFHGYFLLERSVP